MKYVYTVVLLFSLIGTLYAEEQETPKPEPYIPPQQDRVLDERLSKMLPAGQIKWLGEGDGKYLARAKADETGSPLGNILIVTDSNNTIDAPGYIRHAIDYFPSVAWHTMIISAGDLDFTAPEVKVPDSQAQTTEDTSADSEAEVAPPEPMLVPESEWYQAQHKANVASLIARVNLAVDALSEPQRGYILLSSGAAASLLSSAIKDKQISPKALAIIDIDYPVQEYRQSITTDLRELTIPVLDIYQPMSLAAAEQRQVLSRSPTYQQTLIPAVDSDFFGNENLLLRTVRGWLKRVQK